MTTQLDGEDQILDDSIPLGQKTYGILPVSEGGTGQSTLTGLFNTISPLTTNGDILTHDGTNDIRLQMGLDRQILGSSPTGLIYEYLPSFHNPRAYSNDFYDFNQGVSPPYSKLTAGTGANFFRSTYSNPQIYGTDYMFTGSTSTGLCDFSFETAVSNWHLGNGIGIFKMGIIIPTLSVAGQTFIIRVGMTDTATATNVDIANGSYFEYNSTISPNWRICSANANTRTKVTSSIAVQGNIYTRLAIVQTETTKIDFYVNEVLAGTITTNISTATTGTGMHGKLCKTTGTNGARLDMDYVWCYKIFTTRR